MKTRTILTVILLLALGIQLSAQSTGSIKGRVLDNQSGESLPNANVYIEIGANLVGATADLDGYFTIKPLEPGKYDLNVSYTGYGSLVIKEVIVDGDKITFVPDCKLEPGTELTEAFIYADPLINKDGQVDKVMRSKDIENLPEPRDLLKVITAITPDIMVSENEHDFSFRGARVGDASIVIDGITQRGSEMNLPGGAVSSVTVYTGGIPAKYGDTTGGVIVIHTKSYFEWEAQQRAMGY